MPMSEFYVRPFNGAIALFLCNYFNDTSTTY